VFKCISNAISSYHHSLKSTWLEGKRNRRVDHLISTLVKEMLPNYHTRHDRQSLGFEGPDLSERRRAEILRRAPEIEASAINDLGNGRFSVKSASQPQQYHSVDLTKLHCSCPDWPRVQLCKHLTSVFIHTQGPEECELRFKNAFKTPSPEKEGASERESAPEAQDAVPGSDDSAVLSGLGSDLISLTQQVMSAVSSSPAPETIQSLRSVRNQLTAVFVAAQSGGGPALPPAERIAPNQHSWPETAARMGVRRGQKRKRASNSDSVSAADRIGELNNRKRTRAREGPNGDPRRDEVRDPYGGGEKSGARAKDDARSAAANASMRAAANTVPAPSQSASWHPLRASLPSSQFPPACPINASALPPNTPPVNYLYSYPPSVFHFSSTQP
jgi:hypothetical protein